MKHEKAHRLLKIARGHLDGIIKMVEEEKYCIDIAKQIAAVIAILRKAQDRVLEKHVETCVKDAAKSGDENKIQEKINELVEIMKYFKY